MENSADTRVSTRVDTRVDDPIVLNVGGRTFQSTKSTLSNIPYFAALFRTGMAIPDFIDRSPDAFDSILNHARDSRYPIPIKYAPDADYYGYEVTACDTPPALENSISAPMSAHGEEPIRMGNAMRFEFRRETMTVPQGHLMFVVMFHTQTRDATHADSTYDSVRSITCIRDGLNKTSYNSARLYWQNKIAFNAAAEEWLEYRRKAFNEHVLLIDLRGIAPHEWPLILHIDIEFYTHVDYCSGRFLPPSVFFNRRETASCVIVYHDTDERKSIPAPHDQPFDAVAAKLRALQAAIDCREHVYAITGAEQKSIIEYHLRQPSKFTIVPY